MRHLEKSHAELEVEFIEQIAALRASCKAFDEGQEWEAKRIASTIYILVHDGSRSARSLLGQIKKKKTTKFLSSFYDHIDENTLSSFITPFCGVLVQHNQVKYEPNFEAALIGHATSSRYPPTPPKILPMRELRFSSWWDEVVFRKTSGIDISRKNLIFCVRSQDGGAHVDPRIRNMNYRILRTVGDPNLRFVDSGGGNYVVQGSEEGRHIGNIVWPMVRQIGWEIDETFKRIGI